MKSNTVPSVVSSLFLSTVAVAQFPKISITKVDTPKVPKVGNDIGSSVNGERMKSDNDGQLNEWSVRGDSVK